MIVTGSPTMAVVDAMKSLAEDDVALMARVTGVYGHLSSNARTEYPYVVLGRRTRQNDSGTMQKVGGHVHVQLDVWSDHKGASEAHLILSDLARVFERSDLHVSGYEFVRGSLSCEFEEVFDEPDEDSPDRVLYHGLQRWGCEVHES